MKSMRIILSSNEILKYSEVHDYIKNNSKKYLKVDSISDSKNTVKVFLQSYGSILLNNSRDEYKFTYRVKSESDTYVCELCDQKNIKTLFLIRNEQNDNEYWVGSSCVKEFGFNTGREMISIALEQSFKEKFPNYKEIISHSKYPILLPSAMQTKLNHLITTFEKKRKEFITEKLKELKVLFDLEEKIIQQKYKINQYISQHINSTWTVKPEVLSWFELKPVDEKVQLESVIDDLNNSGYYSMSNFFKIHEPNHLSFLRKRALKLITFYDSIYHIKIKDKRIIVTETSKSIEYIIKEIKMYDNFNVEIFKGNSIYLNSNLQKYLSLVKTNINIYKYFQNIQNGIKVESFSISDNFVLYEDLNNKERLYKLDLDDVLRNNLDESIDKYINMYKRDFNKIQFIRKDYINENINELSSYKQRFKCNSKGVK